MKQVNFWFIDALLDPLIGLADDDEAVIQYRHLNPNSELEVRQVIKTLLVPYYSRFDPKSKEIAKNSFSYWLSKSNTNFSGLFDSNLMPFDHPENARDFFVWLWDELFEEDYHMQNFSDYQINNDIHAPNLIKLSPET